MTIPSTDRDGRVYVRILETRSDYPETHGEQGKRTLRVGEITTFEPWFAAALVAVRRAEYYDPGVSE